MSAFRIDDPLERIFRRLDAIGGVAAPRTAAYAPLPEEEANSLMDSLLNKSVGGLQWIGETLDKTLGGRAIRGALGGRPEELLSVLPFSDTLGITDPKNAVSGRDLLDQYGITQQNREGFHPIDDPTDAIGDVGGFLAEIALDPGTYLTFGASALGKGGQALKKAGALTGDVIQSGVRGRIGNTVGDVVGRLDDVRKATAMESLAEEAARSGVQVDDLLKHATGGHVGVGLPFMAPAFTIGNSMDGLSGLAANAIGGFGDAIRQSAPGAFVRSLLGRKVLGAIDPIAQDALSPRVERIRGATSENIQQLQDAVRQAPELLDDSKNLAAIAYHTLGPDAPDIARQLGLPEIPELSQATRDVIQQNIDRSRPLYESVQEMGLTDIGHVTDKYMPNFRSRPGNLPEMKPGTDELLGSGRRFKMQYETLQPRQAAVKDIPGGDYAIDTLSKDARFVGTQRLRADKGRDAILEQLWGYRKPGADEAAEFAPEFMDQPALKDVKDAVRIKYAKQKAYNADRAWKKELADVAKQYEWSPKALETAVREELMANADAIDQSREFWKTIRRDASDYGGSEFVKKLLNENLDDAAIPKFDLWYRNLQESLPLPNELRDDPMAIREFLRNGAPKQMYRKGWMRPTRDVMERIATDDNAKEEFTRLAKETLTDAQKQMVADYQKARGLQKWLAKRDPRHVEAGKGIYDRPYQETERLYRTHLVGAQQMSAAVHDMLTESATKIGAGDVIGEGMVPMSAALQAIVKSNTGNKKAAQRMLESAGAFQARNAAKKFGDESISDLYVPAKIVKEAQNVLQTWRTPEEIGNVGKIIDKFTDWFKIGVTAFPAFHTRNLASGQVQNVLNGLVSPAELLPVANMARKVVVGKDAVKGLSELKAFRGMSDAEATKALREYITAFDVWGEKFHGNIPAAADAPDVLFPKSGVQAMEPKLTPRASVSALGELWQTGKDIAAAGTKNLNPFSPEFVGKRLYRTHGEVGRYVEGLNRISGFIGGLKKGLSPAEAAARVKFAQVDYANATAFEKTFLKRAFPFWSFSRGIAENVAKTLTENPGGLMAQSIRASNSARDTGEFLPDYVGESATIPTGTPGQYITSLGLAHETPFEWFATTPTLPGTVRRFGQKVMTQMTPYAKLLVESATGVNLFTGRPQEETYQFPFNGDNGIKRIANTILGDSPLSRGVTTGRKLFDERKSKTLGIKALSLLTGVGIADVSEPERAKELAARRLNEEVLRQSPRIKSRNELYMPQEFRGKETEDEKLMLRLKATLEKKRREANKKKAKQRAAAPAEA